MLVSENMTVLLFVPGGVFLFFPFHPDTARPVEHHGTTLTG